MEKTLDTEELHNKLRALVMNSLVNSYAAERVAFGYEKPGDPAPIDLYLKQFRININDGLHKRTDIPGVYIDEQECISTKQDYAGYVRDLFVYQMDCIFMDAPKDKKLERVGEEIPLPSHFRKYLFGLLPLFTEVLGVRVESNVFDVIPINGYARVYGYSKWHKFVTAILLKPLKSGSLVNGYVKDFLSTPYYIRRLVETRGNNFYLKPIDIYSYEYIFALFSLMLFMSDEHDRLLELKMREWERQYKMTDV